MSTLDGCTFRVRMRMLSRASDGHVVPFEGHPEDLSRATVSSSYRVIPSAASLHGPFSSYGVDESVAFYLPAGGAPGSVPTLCRPFLIEAATLPNGPPNICHRSTA
jgi:hypothetical protein